MKKTKKIILIAAIGVVVLGCIAAPLIIKSHSSISGDMSGKVDEEWQKNEVHIGFGQVYEQGCYSANNDFINPLYFGEGKISYGLYFNIFDDLEVYFVFDNGYTTPIETSHTLVGGDYITIDGETALQYDLANARIVEVWIRTID